ncbi:MAG: DMT family transporter [Rubrivivax sp.]
MTRPDAWVTPALTAAMLVWGLNFPVVKALTHWFDATQIAALRMTVACATFWLLLRWRRLRWPQLNRRQWLGLVACSLLMVVLNQILFAGGMQRTSAVNGALITATAPLAGSLLAALAFGERLHGRHAAALALGFGGVAVVVLHQPGAALGGTGLGDLMVAGSVVSFAAGGVIVQRMSTRLDALQLSTVVYTIGAAGLVLQLLLLQGSTLNVQRLFPGWQPWLMVVASGVMATALANWVWNAAIGRIGVARTSMFVYWVPVFGMGFSTLLLREPLNAWYGLGLLMVLAGSRLAARRG